MATAVSFLESPGLEPHRHPGRVTTPGILGTPGRTYVANLTGHCVDVLAEDGEPLFSFGEFGSGEGQFNEPADVVLATLRSRRDARGVMVAGRQVMVVADRGNHRLQLFGLDGTPVTVIDPWKARTRRVDVDDRSGWPFFRVNPVPQLVLPSALEWQFPFLFVTVGDEEVVAVDLELALLPDFRTWLDSASTVVVRDALSDGLRRSMRDQLPETFLWAMHERVRRDLRLVEDSAA